MTTKKVDTVPMSFRFKKNFKQLLELAAKHDNRTQANFIVNVVLEYCKQHDLVVKEPAKKRAPKPLV